MDSLGMKIFPPAMTFETVADVNSGDTLPSQLI